MLPFFLWQCPLVHTLARMILKCKTQIRGLLVYGPLKTYCCHGVKFRHFPWPMEPGGPGPCLLLYTQLTPLVHSTVSVLAPCWSLALSGMFPCQYLCTCSSIFLGLLSSYSNHRLYMDSSSGSQEPPPPKKNNLSSPPTW